jgi:thiol-disulfide isomerase/thioredoxin
MHSRLENGDRFPTVSIRTVGGSRMLLPDDVAGSYGVILFYRGSWCPYCRAQLAAFARSRESLRAIGVEVVALSVDDAATDGSLFDADRGRTDSTAAWPRIGSGVLDTAVGRTTFGVVAERAAHLARLRRRRDRARGHAGHCEPGARARSPRPARLLWPPVVRRCRVGRFDRLRARPSIPSAALSHHPVR